VEPNAGGIVVNIDQWRLRLLACAALAAAVLLAVQPALADNSGG
jgi:hypothetical protein